MEADNWQGVVDYYASESTATVQDLSTLARVIDELRGARQEADLKQFLVRTVGVDYLAHPPTYQEWLGQIAGCVGTPIRWAKAKA